MKPLGKIIIFTAMAAVGTGIWWTWAKTADSRDNPATGIPHPRLESAGAPSGKAAIRPLGGQRDKGAIDAGVKRWHAELLDQYPELQIEFRDVPDERNGYLKLVELLESGPLPEGFRELMPMLDENIAWDSGKITAFLEEHADFVRKIMEIGGLPDRSARDVDIERKKILSENSGTIPALGRLLGAKARVEVESGNFDSARRTVSAAFGFGSHLDDIENTTMFAAVNGIGIRASTMKVFREHLLPGILKHPAELPLWADVVHFDTDPSESISRLARGEWNWALQAVILPEFLGGTVSLESSYDYGFRGAGEQKNLIEAYSSWQQEVVLEAEASRGAGPWELPPVPTSLLNDEGRERLALFFSYRSIFPGLQAEQSSAAMLDALMAVLLDRPMPTEPITGKPFLWDAGSRTLSPPPELESRGILSPITLP